MKRERGMESERGAALAVHITLLTIRGQCHRVRPAAPLHFTWLHLAPPLRFSPACPPPPRFASLPPCSPSRLLTPDGFSRPLVSLATRARDRESPAPRPPSLLSSSFYLRPLRLLVYRRLLSRVSTSPSSSLPALSSCSWLPVPPRPPPPSILIDRSCTRARSASPHHLVSSPSTRSRSSLSSVLCSFFFLFPLSFCLLSFRRLFFLHLLFEPPLPPLDLPTLSRRLALCSCAWYKLFQKFVLLLLSFNHSQRFEARDVHSSPVQCATLFAPCRLRQPDDRDRKSVV